MTAAAADAAAEAVADTVEAVAESPGKILGFVAVVAGAAVATWWLVKRVGIAAQGAADESGLFAPPAPAPAVPVYRDDDPADDDETGAVAYEAGDWGDHRPAGADYAR